MRPTKSIDFYLPSIIQEANSQAGTWSLAAIRNVRRLKEDFNENDLNKFYQAIAQNCTINCQPVTIYKWAQLLSLMHSSSFPAFDQFYLTKSKKFKAIASQHQLTPLGEAAKSLLDAIPLKNNSNTLLKPPISTSRSHHQFFNLTNEPTTFKHKRNRITCCSPPPKIAL